MSAPLHDSVPMTLRAWRGITPRQWAWTTGVSLGLLLCLAVGLLPPLLGAVPNLFRYNDAWSTMKSLGATVIALSAGYCFMLGIAVAEQGAQDRMPRTRRYVAAGAAAWLSAIAIEVALYVLVPEFAPQVGGMALIADVNALLGRVVWSAVNFGLCGGLALAVYVRFRAARLAREAFSAAELERVAAGREVLASRLSAMRARIEPEFLLGTLNQVEALYDRDPRSGDRMLDGLIAYLRAALPQLRSERSTLQRECALAESYLRIVQMRMGSRLGYTIAFDPSLGALDFPPMVLLPLVDDAVRHGLEPLPHGGAVAIDAALAGDRLRVRVVDDGMPRDPVSNTGEMHATLGERLAGLYGDAGRLESYVDTPHGVVATVEVPRADARDHR